MHKRQVIRSAISSLLQNINGLNVINSRVNTITQLPSGVVSTKEESNEVFNISNTLAGQSYDLLRTLNVSVELYVEDSENVADELDELVELVEIELGSDQTLGGLVIQSVLSASEFDYSGEGETPYAKSTLSFEYQYTTPANNPSN